MDHFPLYIPDSSASPELRRKVVMIDPRSAIVGEPSPCGEELLVYFEGNRYRAANIRTFADRAMIAAGRLSERYPTIAQASVPAGALVQVGLFTPAQGVEVPDDRSLLAIALWLGLLDGTRPDRAALARELRLTR
jgi:hypothetical protein